MRQDPSGAGEKNSPARAGPFLGGRGSRRPRLSRRDVYKRQSMGWLIGLAFFILVFFAALTSGISRMETVVSILHDKCRWNRRRATIVTALGSILIGVPSSLGFGLWASAKPLGMSILDFFDFLSKMCIRDRAEFLPGGGGALPLPARRDLSGSAAGGGAGFSPF